MKSIVLALAIITLPQLAQAADWATITVAQAAMWPPQSTNPYGTA